MNRSGSVSTILILTISLLSTALLFITAYNTLDAWSDYRQSIQVGELSRSERGLFINFLDFRVLRGQAIVDLLGKDDPKAALADNLSRIDKLIPDAIAIGRKSDLPQGREALAKLEGFWKDYQTGVQSLKDEMNKPRSERSLNGVKPWADSNQGISDAFGELSLSYVNTIRLSDATSAELVQIHQLGWRLRERYGLECGVRTNISSGTPLPEAMKIKMIQLRTTISGDWDSLGGILKRAGAPQDLAADIATATEVTRKAQAETDRLLAKLDGGGTPVMGIDDYNAICNQPFGPLGKLAVNALDRVVAHAEDLRQEALTRFLVTLAILVFALALGAWGGWTVHRRVSKPIGDLMDAIRHLTDRDYERPVPALRFDDELGKMSRALETLRKGAQTAERLAAEESQRQAEGKRRSSALESLCRDFDNSAGQMTGRLGDSATSLQGCAHQMEETTQAATRQADQVAVTALRAAANVQTVAAATEELNASIAEISSRVQGSAEIARQASEQASRTNVTVEELSAAAQRIGEVVQLINDIAAQTNLLALNATIEAARAGDAGKGFAVVANEVKHLANQTAKATDEIGQQISSIQSTTANAVSAIREITDSIARINETSSAIAAAVEEQGAATQEIARNVQLAAQGTQEVTETIQGVAADTRKTEQEAQNVLGSARSMVGEVDGLRQGVQTFLDGVRKI
ncbi:MAG TPA: HAMP domain-containing methyl-accepting chemotaxis protein [Candidatus Sulfotelmatobacter sp.]|jgi:methyl-accepting chemotaxis protein|nr:HAMP domain-containing methyl-accepting chemotaxis protein [Candidatus Sulfotelmatobacter sp.]